MRRIKKKRGGERQRLGGNKEEGRKTVERSMEKMERGGRVWVLAMSQNEKWVLE